MSDIITNAGATGTDGAAVPTEAQRVAAAAALMGGEPKPEPAKAPEPKQAEAAPSLAEVIKAQRAAREQASQEAQKRTSLEADLAKARAEVEALRKSAAFEDDPVGFAKSRKWTPEQQLLYGQQLLYDLAPDKADPQLRIKMFEDKQKRREREEAEAAEKAKAEAETKAQEAEREAAARDFETFQTGLREGVKQFSAGSYPESEDYFGDDAEVYLKSLTATAMNLATQAKKNNQVADLSPQNLAKVLEAEMVRRMTARDQRKQKRSPQQAPHAAAAQKAADAVQSIETTSTKHMNGSGTPRPPALTEKERVARAVAAGFPSR